MTPDITWDSVVNADFSIARLVVGALMVIALSQILAWHYVRFSDVLSNRRKFARILVFIATTTLLVISVIKTSLALSLGLVGALSIIRFRTPVKEPEELAYLFLAIAVGIGVGAGQTVATTAVFGLILIYLSIRHWNRGTGSASLLQVTTALKSDSGEPVSGEAELSSLQSTVNAIASRVDLRRVDRHENALNVTLLVEVQDAGDIGRLLAGIEDSLPGSSVTFVDKDSVE